MIDAANLSEGLLTLHISNWQGGRGGVSSSKFSNGWVNIPERKKFRNILSMSFSGIFPLIPKTHSVPLLLCGGEILLMLKASNKSCKASLFDGRIDLVSQAWTKRFGIHCGINQDLPSDEISICSAELFYSQFWTGMCAVSARTWKDPQWPRATPSQPVRWPRRSHVLMWEHLPSGWQPKELSLWLLKPRVQPGRGKWWELSRNL